MARSNAFHESQESEYKDLSSDDEEEISDESGVQLTESEELRSDGEKNSTKTSSFEVMTNDSEAFDPELGELRNMLPAFPESRLRKIRDVFDSSLGNPPMLELIPAVRETMPDYVTATWLKKMSFLTAKFVAHQASVEEKLDIYVLNSILELYTASGSIDTALEFHQSEFNKCGLQQTEYSDRLVLQMLLSSNRFSRALQFKETVEKNGRKLDLKAYGSLVEFCSRRNQLGSALFLVQECIDNHREKPEEAVLKRLRLLSRQAGLSEMLEDLVGQDPLSKYLATPSKRCSSCNSRVDSIR